MSTDAEKARVDLAKAFLFQAHDEVLAMTDNLNQIMQAGQGIRIIVTVKETEASIHVEIVPQPISFKGVNRPTTKLSNLTPDTLRDHLKSKGVDTALFEFKADTSGAVIVRKKAKISDELYKLITTEIKSIGGEWVGYEQANPDVTGLWRVKP